MPMRRPSPLSDELFAPGPPARGPVLLGATNNGMPLPVKNTFLDIPSGHTPSSMRGWREPMMTAPAGLNKTVALKRQASPLPEGERASGAPAPEATAYRATPSERAPEAEAEEDTYDQRVSEPALSEADCDEDAESDGDSEEDGTELVSPRLRNPEDAPKPPPGALHPSIGSAGHATGSCKRCCFFPRGRCANGYACEFCHFEHDRRKRKNKKKTVRARGGPCSSRFLSRAPAREAMRAAVARALERREGAAPRPAFAEQTFVAARPAAAAPRSQHG